MLISVTTSCHHALPQPSLVQHPPEKPGSSNGSRGTPHNDTSPGHTASGRVKTLKTSACRMKQTNTATYCCSPWDPRNLLRAAGHVIETAYSCAPMQRVYVTVTSKSVLSKRHGRTRVTLAPVLVAHAGTVHLAANSQPSSTMIGQHTFCTIFSSTSSFQTYQVAVEGVYAVMVLLRHRPSLVIPCCLSLHQIFTALESTGLKYNAN
jgi:hypothetical protein